MKKMMSILFLALTVHAVAQETSDNKIIHQSWTFLYDQTGNAIASEKATQGKYYLKTVFNFINENKYEFSLDEFDAAGVKLAQVTENGSYTVTAAQFTLNPKSSETIFDPPSKQNLRSVASVKIVNPPVAATYSWLIEKDKTGYMGSLNITAVKPGYREGQFSSTATSRARGARQLPPDKRRSIARSM